jgi:hypothetical protein
MIRWNSLVTFLFLLFGLTSCSSMPQPELEPISIVEAKGFLGRFCSRVGSEIADHPAIHGDLLVRSSTREFKGQYPASVSVSQKGDLVLEVTNLIGGTVALLKGDTESLEVISSVKPQYSRKNIRNYMGLPVQLLVQLLHGDLPCPRIVGVEVEGSAILIRQQNLNWKIERSDAASGGLPLRVTIEDQGMVKIEMLIERWNSKESYAEKVKVKTAEGELRWTWRNRAIQN